MNATRLEQLAREGFTRVPVVRRLLADLETPLGAYLKFAGPFSFLFESVEGGEKWGRYSIIGLPCRRAPRGPRRAHHALRRGRGAGRRARRSARLRRGIRRARARVPARGPADVRGRPRGLFRLRLRAHGRAAPRRERAARRARHARHPADGRRGIPGLRQPGRCHRAGRHGRPARGGRRGRRRGAARCAAAAPRGAGAAAAAGGHRCRAARQPARARGRGGVRVGVRPRAFRGRGGAHPRIHPRRRRDAGGALAAHERAVQRQPAQPLPGAAQPQSLAVPVLPRSRRFPDRGLLAGDPVAPAGRRGHRAPDRRHAPARRHARGGPRAGGRAAGRSEGDRRAPDADRPRAQRRGARGRDRQRDGVGAHDRRALLARDAHRLQRLAAACARA